MPRKPDPKVHTINDCPEVKTLLKVLNRYQEPSKFHLLKGFTMGLAGNSLHFSRQTGYEKKLNLPTRDRDIDSILWASWTPRRSEVLKMVNAYTCPKEELLNMHYKNRTIQ